jgi:histidyl-tRNA synthetase
VFVASIGAGLVPERMKVSKMLWDANFSAEYSHQDNPKFKKQLEYALEVGIPYLVVFGEEEIQKGTVKVKNMGSHTEEEIPLTELTAYLKANGCQAVSNAPDEQLLTAMRDMNILDN